ncbi:hypothetical protein PIROE2DRAFT_18792 [Piromyces sp. E2]|nr:hypothetical protein PIROE2DRAFT_18792 [Piromyces sp. E2]|eukprot:OUM56553.1 hypothetical protein PIROE2DRAFT_18792 [Piromyces sp. E2]
MKFNNNIDIKPKYFHCDFEIGISNAAKIVFPDINIKYFIWHYRRSLENHKNGSLQQQIETIIKIN